jgi:Tfp pilus assembly protein PilF
VLGSVPRPADMLFRQAREAQDRGDFDTAKDRYERAIGAGDATPQLYNNFAVLLLDRGKVAESIAMLHLALSLDGAYGNAWVNLGVALARDGNHAAAGAAYEQALKLNRFDTATKVNLAIEYHTLGSLADARRMLEDVLRDAPALAPAHYELGRVLEDMHDIDGAIRHYERYVGLAPLRDRDRVEYVRAYIPVLKSKR